jgi:cobW/hypB/ureG, nucleotide-binding domain
VTFIGFKCKYEDESSIPHKSWITITARVHVEFAREYKGKGPVLYPVSIEPAEKPQDELVYFS